MVLYEFCPELLEDERAFWRSTVYDWDRHAQQYGTTSTLSIEFVLTASGMELVDGDALASSTAGTWIPFLYLIAKVAYRVVHLSLASVGLAVISH